MLDRFLTIYWNWNGKCGVFKLPQLCWFQYCWKWSWNFPDKTNFLGWSLWLWWYVCIFQI